MSCYETTMWAELYLQKADITTTEGHTFSGKMNTQDFVQG